MNDNFDRLRDPNQKLPLSLKGEVLVAVDGSRYPIVGNIPRFVPSENYADDFGKQWNLFPATQLDSHSGITLSRDRVERCVGGDLKTLAGMRVLEAGSGAGRFTEVLLAAGARLDSFDFSSAVEANAANNKNADFCLVQADINAIPFASRSYDFVICLGVLQHTPSPEQSIASLYDMVAPGGRLVIDHYRWNFWKRMPPPIGDAEKFYRWIALRLPANRRFEFVRRLVDFWFPIYWRTRKSKIARKLLNRIAGIHFHYPQIPLASREQYYEWALLDTHDGQTDRFKHYRSAAQIEQVLRSLGAIDIRVSRAGNGVEAICTRPSARSQDNEGWN